MLFVKYDIHASVEDVIASLKDQDALVEAEKFNTEAGKPKLHIRRSGDRLKLQCEIVNGTTADRDFKLGTTFHGKITHNDGVTSIRGIILTAPIYHLILVVLFGYFIYQCISLKGVSIVPICLVVFDVFMFWREFKKQAIIKRFILRALKITYQSTQKRRSASHD